MACWPDDPPVEIRLIADLNTDDEANVSYLSMAAHTGTHIDAPRHYLTAGTGVDTMPFEAAIGPARVIAINDPAAVTAAELSHHDIRPGERVLFKTENSQRPDRWRHFDPEFIYVATEAGRYLAERGVWTVGIDYLSVGGYRKNEKAVHQALLEAGIWIIEGLELDGVEPGRYELLCLPLKLTGGDGAPARALLRPV